MVAFREYHRSAEATTDDNGEVQNVLLTIDGPVNVYHLNIFKTPSASVSEPSTSPSRITSSPSHSPEPSPSPKPSPSPEPSPSHLPDHTTVAPTQPSPTQPSTGTEHYFPTPHDSPLHAVHSHGSDEGCL
ncbi:hypothetical protein Tco_1202625 [Tanacetum coccineum]